MSRVRASPSPSPSRYTTRPASARAATAAATATAKAGLSLDATGGIRDIGDSDDELTRISDDDNDIDDNDGNGINGVNDLTTPSPSSATTATTPGGTKRTTYTYSFNNHSNGNSSNPYHYTNGYTKTTVTSTTTRSSQSSSSSLPPTPSMSQQSLGNVVPPNFGGPEGPTIVNKTTILSEIDAALGVSKPPALEVIIVEPARRSFTGTNWFGHGLARYQWSPGDVRTETDMGNDPTSLPSHHIQSCDRATVANDGHWSCSHDIVMNIVGVKGMRMVNFVPTEDYFFGTSGYGKWSEQGGMYNRSFASIRVENLDPSRIRAIHATYVALKAAQESRSYNFSLIGFRLGNFISKYLPFTDNTTASGNCSYWTSQGLIAGGLLNRARIFPKGILYEILEREQQRDPKNVNIVYYKRAFHAKESFEPSTVSGSIASPLQLIRNLRYWNMEQMADVVVEIPEGTSRAIARRQKGRRPPTHWFARQAHSLCVMIMAAMIYIYEPLLWPLALALIIVQYWWY